LQNINHPSLRHIENAKANMALNGQSNAERPNKKPTVQNVIQKYL
jgi:hypothetical protein